MSPERLQRFFIPDGDGFRVGRELREMVLFAKHNLLKDPPFSRLDLITCRNLLIYFNHAAQKRAMETFHFASNPGAFVFLGTSESIDGASDLFASVSKEHRVFQSREVVSKIQYQATEMWQPMLYGDTKKAAMSVQERENRLLERISFSELHQMMLEKYAAPSLVINENYDIVHLSPKAGRFLQFAGGEPTKNLLQLVRPELRLEIRTALFQAVQRRANVIAADVKVQTDGQPETISVQIRPVLRADDTARGFLLVLFNSSRTEDGEETAEKIILADAPVTRQLEEELERTKAELRYSVEQYEAQTEEMRASNEELQAINEELRTTAEQLETSREELQSVNEELLTVNDELKFKIEELSQSNSDFQNLLTSTDIGTIFLDRNLRVKMFTSVAREVFSLIDSDLNRPLADIATKMNFVDLEKDVQQVLKTLQTVEREFENGRGKWLLMRVYPSRTAGDHINGTVITFIDITRRIESEQALSRLAQSREQQSRIFDTALSSIADFAYTFDRAGRFIYANKPLLDLLDLSLEEVSGRTFRELPYPTDLAEKLMSQIERVFRTKKPVTDETPFINPAGEQGFYEYIFSPVVDETGAVEVVAGSTRVTTERRRAEMALRESEERLRLLVESATDYAIFTISPDNLVDSWNAGAEKVFGWKEEDIIGKSGAILFTPEDREKGAADQEIETAAATGRAEDERWHLRGDGSRFFASGVMMRLKDGKGFVKIARDQTDKITTEKAVRDKEMLQKLIGAQEDERKRIARDLHDELGQKLTALRFKLEAARRICDEDKICDAIDEAQLLAKNIDEGVDFLAWELRPASLDDLGLIAALENYAREWSRHSGVTIEFHAAGLSRGRLVPEIEINLYRIAQEALNNTHKHAKAARANVLLEKRGGTVILIIEDDGKGFKVKDKKTRSKGLGLVGMRERASLVGGALEIESAPKQGTTIFARIPATFVTRGKNNE